jgi:hypothetical protein
MLFGIRKNCQRSWMASLIVLNWKKVDETVVIFEAYKND